jgi:pimeloyl-ACP methyl ester carboxylesterase
VKNKIFLMRGLIREKRHWGKLPGTLQALYPDKEIILMDIPGNGELSHLPSFTRMSANVHFLRDQMIKKYGPPDKGIMVALSLGGMVATQWAYLYPEDWGHILLVNTSMAGINPIYKRMKLTNIPKLLHYALTRSQKKRQEIAIALSITTMKDVSALVEEWTAIAQNAPVSLINTVRQMRAAIGFKAKKTPPQTPITVMVGLGDNLVSPDCSLQIANAWDLPVMTHAQGGHNLDLDEPQWFLEQLRLFIDGHK